jgi:hypothetical protein
MVIELVEVREGIDIDPTPLKALLGALTILINLYQNCFAPFGYAEGIAPTRYCAEGIAHVEN